MAIWIHGRRRRRRVDFILLEDQDVARANQILALTVASIMLRLFPAITR